MLIHTADRGMSQRKYLYTHSLILHSRQKLWKLIFLFKMKCQAFTLPKTPRRLAGSKRHHRGSQRKFHAEFVPNAAASLHPVQPQTDPRVAFSKPPFFLPVWSFFFPYMQSKSDVPQFEVITPCPATTDHGKKASLQLFCTSFKHWNTTIRPPQNKPKCLSLPSPENPSSSLTIFMALLWSYSKSSMSVLYPGPQSWTQTSRGSRSAKSPPWTCCPCCFWCIPVGFLGHIQFFTDQHPQVAPPSLHWHWQWPWPMCWTSQLAWMNFIGWTIGNSYISTNQPQERDTESILSSAPTISQQAHGQSNLFLSPVHAGTLGQGA